MSRFNSHNIRNLLSVDRLNEASIGTHTTVYLNEDLFQQDLLESLDRLTDVHGVQYNFKLIH